MGRHDRRVLMGAVIAIFCALCLLIVFGFRASRSSLLSSSSAFLHASLPTAKTPGPLTGVVVILDPGHGGQDPGTTCGPVSEAALTYRTADEVAACLRAQGAVVTYTVRSRQLDPALAITEPPLIRPANAVMASTGRLLRLRNSPRPLWQRAEWAESLWVRRVKWDPDARQNVFFVSLHYDQYRAEGISGCLVCVDRRVRCFPALAAALAGQMASGHFARRDDYRGLRGVSGRELGVLDPAHNPVPETVLLELATLSNPQDALQASDASWRTEMARRITRAILLVHQQKIAARKASPNS